MFRQQTDGDEVARNRLEYRKPLQQSERQRGRRRPRRGFFVGNAGRDDEPMRDPLKGLRQHRRGPASALNLAEAPDDHVPLSQRLSKNPASGDGILHGEIDSDAADG